MENFSCPRCGDKVIVVEDIEARLIYNIHKGKDRNILFSYKVLECSCRNCKMVFYTIKN